MALQALTRAPWARSVQALVFTGHVQCCPVAEARAYSMPTSVAAARAFLAWLAPRITFTEERGPLAHHVALSSGGLARLGVPEAIRQRFPRELAEGMADEERARALGDEGPSDPAKWAWGGPNAPADVLVLVYASSQGELDDALRGIENEARARGLVEVHRRPLSLLADGKEHFGFHDGIAQPTLVPGRPKTPNETPIGDFVLGQPDTYGQISVGPELTEEEDPQGLLDEQGIHSLGRHGSYLVVREIHQDVELFWRTLDDEARKLGEPPGAEARERLAAKLVGRQKDGTPLVVGGQGNPTDEFGYAHDLRGLRCPVGAHIRRANPRDGLGPASVEAVRARRILRRGRVYGPPNFDPLTNPDPAPVERGLFFVCVNANIRRQFEFIQQTWIANPKFGGLYDEEDPLLSQRLTRFSIPSDPFRKRTAALPAFTTIRGGGYFFLPGREAIAYLSADEG